MAISINPPLLTPMPPAPTPNLPEEVFDQYAGASLTAQDNLVDEQNLALTWQAGAMAETKGFKDAAAESAGNAADSASSAATVGGQAVAAAQAARDAAATSAASAQASAQAAGDAAGFPDFVDGLDVLQVNETKTGVKWGKVGQSVGDTLITNRPAPAGYVEAGGIYSQAAYPELFALLGTKEANNDGVNWAALTGPGASADYMAVGKDDVIIGISNTASSSVTGGRAFRSTDGGVTWASVAGLLGKESLDKIACDQYGNWFVGAHANSSYFYSSNDNGLTWTQRAKPFGNGVYVYGLASGQPGVLVMCVYTSASTNTTFYYSTNYGATWTKGHEQVSYTLLSSVITDGKGTWLATLQFGGSYMTLASYDNFATVSYGPDTGNYAGCSYGIMLGVATINKALNIYTDGVSTSKSVPNFSSSYILVDSFGVIHAVSSGTGIAYRSYDKGDTWSKYAVFGAPLVLLSTSTVMLKASGTWINCYNGVWRKSTRLYNYDTSTQFKVPAIKAPQGLKAYVKAKAA